MAKQLILDDGAFNAVRGAIVQTQDALVEELKVPNLPNGVKFAADESRKALARAVKAMRAATVVEEKAEAEAA